MSKKLEKPVENGLIYNLTYEQYSALPAANYSTLKHFEKSALHARQEMIAPKDSTKALDFGVAVHALVFESERFAKEFVCAPKCDKRTTIGQKTWNDFIEANGTKTCVVETEWQLMHAIAASLRKHKLASQLIELPGKCEVSATWMDQDTQTKCRCRMDKFLNFHGWPVIVDLKTCDNPAKNAFRYQVLDYFYNCQAAFYLDGLNEIAKAERRHFLIAAEKKPPFDCVVYELDEEALASGRKLYKKWLQRYKECMESNDWPGISSALEPLSLKRGDLLNVV